MTDTVVAAGSASSVVAHISDSEFRLFQRLMFDEAGVTLAASKKALVRGRLSKRLRIHGCASFSNYHKLIREDRDERQHAVDLLTTNETYFFREAKHFTFLRDVAVPAHSAGRPYRVWSAACSTGEEVYSIAMVLADVMGLGGWSVVGSDLNTQVLAKARLGHYSLARTEGIPRQSLRQYCLKGTASQAGTFLVNSELRERIEFRQVNLNVSLPKLELFDAIFLRNVMIYFSQDTKANVVRRVMGQLRPGGYLFIGHSESLNGIASDVELVRPSIYRRPA